MSSALGRVVDRFPLTPVVRVPLRLGGFAAYTAFMLSVAQIHQKLADEGRQEEIFDRYRRRWCRGWLRLMGAELSIVLPPPPTSGRGLLVVANHRAFFDIPALLSQVGGSFLSRADVAGWPLFGAAARAAGTIFVDRAAKQSGSSAVRAMRDKLARGGTVLVFPEGTTYSGDELRPFRAGAFVAARGLPVDIVGAGIAYAPGTEMGEESSLRHISKTAIRSRTPMAMAFGGLFAAGDDVDGMVERSRAELSQLIASARRAIL